MVAIRDLSTVLHEGLLAHQAGNLEAARARYSEVLRAVPQQADALHLLGVVALQQGQLADACASIRAALDVAPDQATYWNSLGTAEQLQAQPDRAAESFSRAVALAPAYAEAWAGLANARAALLDAAGEEAALTRVTELVPTDAGAWGRRGILAFQAGRLADARRLLERTVTLAPEHAGAWSNLGIVQLSLGRLADAEASQRRALAVGGEFVDGLNNLGNVLVAQSRWAEAAEALSRAVALAPEQPNCWVNLGHARKGLEQLAEAVAAYERALALQPALPAALVGLADALQGLQRLDEAVGLYERALLLHPDDAETYEHLAIALHRLGRLPESVAAYRRSLAIAPDRPHVHSGLIFVLDLMQGADLDERRRWNERFGKPTRRVPASYPNHPDPDRRLRVGYVSADFCHHSVASAMLPIFRSHDHTTVEVVCYSGVKAPDATTAQFRALTDVWHDTAHLSDDDLAALIQADGIDLLIDLSGHSGGNRLPVFTREPAPVQITAWGYAAGTGLSVMDYFLADRIIIPPDAHGRYTEEIVDLPSLLCYEASPDAPPVAPLPALSRRSLTFGAFNRLPKITAEAVATWGRVLAALPTARLLIKSGGLEHAAPRAWLLAGIAAQGGRPDQVSFLGGTPHAEHLAAHAEIDLMLDTFPQGGGITTLDSLLMGVPVITLLGERVPGRTSASFLTTLGLADLVAPTVDEYVAVAVRAASDLDRLARERSSLRERLFASPIGDAQRYTRAVEETYRALWRRWCDARREGRP